MINDPGALLAAVVATLTQRAEPRLLALLWATGDAAGGLGSYRTVELPLDAFTETAEISAAIDAVLAPVLDAVAGEPTETVALIVVDAHPFRGFRHRYRLLAERARTRLSDHDLTLVDLWIVTGLRPGSPWIGLSVNTRGVIEHSAPEGDDDFTPDAVRAAEVAALLAAHRIPAIDTARKDRSPRRSRARWRRIRDAAAALDTPRRLEVGELAALAEALGDPDLRDYLYALASGSGRRRWVGLWEVLVRELPAGHRAVAAMLLAITHHVEARPRRARAALAVARTDRCVSAGPALLLAGLGDDPALLVQITRRRGPLGAERLDLPLP
ncbi:DUF4192 family protein [Nocardia takedensis]|uniref:DUF4192 family protein n=1 Tax=Nocardia takedensis TaxID=259390 RepID=UPI003F767E46